MDDTTDRDGPRPSRTRSSIPHGCYISLLTEDTPGGHSGDNSGTLLEGSTLVPNTDENGSGKTTDSESETNGAPGHTTNTLAIQEQDVETLPLVGLRRRYDDANLSEEARELLTDNLTADTSTNRSYQRGQQLFVNWAMQHDVDLSSFTFQDLINISRCSLP